MRTALVLLLLLAFPGSNRAEEGTLLAGPAPLVVVLKSQVTVASGSPVRLDAVAELRGARAEEAGAVTVAEGPAPGRCELLLGPEILRRLEAAGFSNGQVELNGTPRVRLQGEGEPLDEPALRKEIEAEVAQRCPDCRIAELMVPRGAIAPVGGYTTRITPPAAGVGPGVNRFTLEIPSQNGSVRAMTITARIEARQNVVIPLRDFQRGERLVPADFRVETRPTAIRTRWITDPAALGGMIARAALRQGQPVPVSAVGTAAAVEPGQPVSAVFQQGTVTIAMQSKSRSRGDVGAIVSVTGLDGHRLVQARVIGPGRVVILGSQELQENAPLRAEVNP